MGFLVSQHGQFGAIPPPLFWAFPPWRACEVEVQYPPLKRGISAILARYPMKTRQMGAIPPLCDTISKGYCAIWGGISHWAAKNVPSCAHHVPTGLMHLGCDPARLLERGFRASGPKLFNRTRKEKCWFRLPPPHKNPIFEHFSYFSANFFLLSGGRPKPISISSRRARSQNWAFDHPVFKRRRCRCTLAGLSPQEYSTFLRKNLGVSGLSSTKTCPATETEVLLRMQPIHTQQNVG